MADYERAYAQTKGKGGVIPPSALAGAGYPITKSFSLISSTTYDGTLWNIDNKAKAKP